MSIPFEYAKINVTLDTKKVQKMGRRDYASLNG